MILGFGLFNRAGATGHVFFVKNGKRLDRGLAYSGIVGPGTAVAIVPTIQQIVDFSVAAITADKQDVSVNGNVKVTLSPQDAVATFDFTVEPASGAYKARWENNLRSLVMERVLGPVQAKAKTYKLEDITSAQPEIEAAVLAAIGSGEAALLGKGISIDSCSIPDILPADEDLGEALGAKEREALLTEADGATHMRQMQSVANARAVKTYEAKTALALEQERGQLIKEQNTNKLEEAKTDAEALGERMKPLTDLDSGQLLALAIYRMGDGGRIGTVNLTPDLLETIRAGVVAK